MNCPAARLSLMVLASLGFPWNAIAQSPSTFIATGSMVRKTRAHCHVAAGRQCVIAGGFDRKYAEPPFAELELLALLRALHLFRFSALFGLLMLLPDGFESFANGRLHDSRHTLITA
jgi:hypothetical protein